MTNVSGGYPTVTGSATKGQIRPNRSAGLRRADAAASAPARAPAAAAVGTPIFTALRPVR